LRIFTLELVQHSQVENFDWIYIGEQWHKIGHNLWQKIQAIVKVEVHIIQQGISLEFLQKSSDGFIEIAEW
jgi:hypothetical protein